MDDVLPYMNNYGEAVKRRLPLGLVVMLLLLVITVALALGLPSRYKSRAVVLIEAQEIPQDLVRSLVTSFADQRMQMISQRVLTNSNLTGIIQKYGLYAEKRSNEPLELVLEDMRDDISMLPISADVVDPKQGKAVQATIAFEIAYENESPELAQRVANEIVSLFLNENLKQRTETSEETLGFLSAESEKLRDAVSELESKLAEFKQANMGKLPELANLNLELMTRTEQQVTQLDTQIQALQQQRVYLESELALQKPTSELISETGQRILGPSDRLKVLESEFVPLAARYGSNHPDVVAKKKELDSLRGQVGMAGGADELRVKLENAKATLAAALQKYSADHPDVKRLTREVASLKAQIDASAASTYSVPSGTPPDNPAYIQLKARLEATETDIGALRAQQAGLQSKLNQLEERITSAPTVEREYRMLMRDYEIAQAKYQEVLAKRQEAELASNLESKQRGERFTLIEPPIIPEQPDKPNRLAIGLLGTLLSLAGGVGSGALVEAFDTRVYGRTGVTKIIGVPPLAVIPKIDTSVSVASRRRKWLIAVSIALAMVIAAAIAAHMLIGPLDVLVFRVARALGL
jgi:succinoglycan biosynthesis transport protein ExoP